jgi:flagellar biosynthesis protein
MARRRAIALEYDGQAAPRVTASGQDALAERIISVAREHGVPLLENNELAALLSSLDLGDEIPEMLYVCVAQIIAFAYTLRGKAPQGWVDPTAPEGDWLDPDAGETPLLTGPHGGQP